MVKIRVFIRDHLTSFRIILIGFVLLILVGAFLLTLPVASASAEKTPFLDALFTSASATCVTGLVVRDTATYWSSFGKCIILFLIQIGGLGVVSVAVFMMVLSGRQIGIHQRSVMQDAISAPQIGGIVRFTKFFILGTLLFESLGVLALLPVFIPDYGLIKGFCFSVFHSVSAFCNAGFDLMGGFSSLTFYKSHIWLNLIIMLLIIAGGIGFSTWRNLLEEKFKWRNLNVQTKIILFTTAVLLLLPYAYFYCIEFSEYALKERILFSAFQSVTPRTAGFNTFDYSAMSEGGLLITILLMLIGGAPGSTAGGMKVTTVFVLVLASISNLQRNENVNCFKRRMDYSVIQNAFSILMVYFWMLAAGTIILSRVESIPVIHAMFECASALGTVGLTVGITPVLSPLSKIILILFMYFGRVGGLTIAYAAVSTRRKAFKKYPMEKIAIG